MLFNVVKLYYWSVKYEKYIEKAKELLEFLTGSKNIFLGNKIKKEYSASGY